MAYPGLVEPVCMAGILRLQETGAEGRPLIIFANPDTIVFTRTRSSIGCATTATSLSGALI